MADHTSVAVAVRDAAHAQQMSDARLAELAFIPRSSLIRKLAGVSEFKVSELIRIGDALGIDPADFLRTTQVAA